MELPEQALRENMVYKASVLWIILFFTVLMWIKEQMENGTAGFSEQILMEKEKHRSAECFREP